MSRKTVRLRARHERSQHPLVVAIGGSAGSIHVVEDVVRQLPPDLDAIVLFAIHRSYDRRSYLPEMLRRARTIKIVEIVDSEALESAVGYISEPSEHLTVGHDGYRARLLPDPDRLRRNQSIDELFASVAETAGPRAVGILLSGLRKDGTQGLGAIKRAGGTTIVQDTREAEFPDMPASAIVAGVADHVLSHHEIPRVVARLAATRSEVRQR